MKTLRLPDRYQPLSLLGRGGFGAVWRAEDRSLKRQVAIKVLSKGSLDQVAEARFLEEARTVSKLDHASILQVYDFGKLTDDQGYYLVTELLTGGTLAEKIDQGPDPRQVLAWAHEISKALAYLEEMGVSHRDLKPENILLRPDQSPVLADFGISKSKDRQGFQTATGWIVGTPEYLAPEIFRGEPWSQPAEVYAFGITFLEVLEGPGFLPPRDLARMLESAASGEILFRPPSASTPFSSYLQSCCKWDPKTRPQNFQALERALSYLRSGPPAKAPAAPGIPTEAARPQDLPATVLLPNPKPTRNGAWMVGFLGLLGVLGLGIFAGLGTSGWGTPPSKARPESPQVPRIEAPSPEILELAARVQDLRRRYEAATGLASYQSREGISRRWIHERSAEILDPKNCWLLSSWLRSLSRWVQADPRLQTRRLDLEREPGLTLEEELAQSFRILHGIRKLKHPDAWAYSVRGVEGFEPIQESKRLWDKLELEALDLRNALSTPQLRPAIFRKYAHFLGDLTRSQSSPKVWEATIRDAQAGIRIFHPAQGGWDLFRDIERTLRSKPPSEEHPLRAFAAVLPPRPLASDLGEDERAAIAWSSLLVTLSTPDGVPRWREFLRDESFLRDLARVSIRSSWQLGLRKAVGVLLAQRGPAWGEPLPEGFSPAWRDFFQEWVEKEERPQKVPGPRSTPRDS